MPEKRLRAGIALLAMAAALAPGTIAPAQDARPRPSLNLYGVTGLIDMPSAESRPRIGYSKRSIFWSRM